MKAGLHIVIDAQINLGGSAGGVEQFIAGLVHGLGTLDGSERYTVVGPSEKPDWLKKFLGSNQCIVSAPRPAERLRTIKRVLGPVRRPLRSVINTFRQAARARRTVWPVPESGGFYEALGCEVIHFPHQSFIRSTLPTIYNPHDLQHRHLPDFFSPGEFAKRETLYRAGCKDARTVAAASRWAAEDIERSYGVSPDRMVVIPSGASTELYEPVTQETLIEVRSRYRLPEVFALYPAQTWPHKNHLGLIRALALLRQVHRLTLHVVCTGAKNRFFRTIAMEASEWGVPTQLTFPGYIPGRDLRALYHLARFLVFPSFFEGGGLPVVEALAEGLPVACSSTTSLPEIVGDAALHFDPASADSMAGALQRMATDDALLETLRIRGRRRVGLFSWERMARSYRALYRYVGGRRLCDEDRELVAACRLPPRGP